MNPRRRGGHRLLLPVALGRPLGWAAAGVVAGALVLTGPASPAGGTANLAARSGLATDAGRVPAGPAPLPPSGPVPSAAAVAAAITGPLRSTALGGAVVGEVSDGNTGAALWSRGASVPVTAASTTKLLTAVAALANFPATARPHTTVLTTATLSAGVVSGDVVLRGGGDVLFTAGPAANPSGTWPARAGADQLAAALRAAGVARVTGALVADGSTFTGAMTAPGWRATYVTQGSIAPVTALGVDEAGAASGTRGDRSGDPRLAAAAAFRAALTREGIAVAGPTRIGTTPVGARPLATVAGAPVASEVEEMLQDSDNDMAESLGRRLALRTGEPATFAGAAAAVTAAVARAGIAAAGVRLEDTSGLSHGDRVPVATLASILYAARRGAPALRPISTDLAVGGFNGTLAGRYRTADTAAGAGLVRAKTGYLQGVSALAGEVVDRSGTPLLFVWVSDTAGSRAAAEAAWDRAAAALAGL